MARYTLIFFLSFIPMREAFYAKPDKFDVGKALNYCVQQAAKTAAQLSDPSRMPRSIDNGQRVWKTVPTRDWTSGFWPGILWYVAGYTRDPVWKRKADSASRALWPLAYSRGFDHDLGFQLYCSLGNGYRLTGDTAYKRVLLAGADSLATLFNPKVGTLLSWPPQVAKMGWPHNTIIDNMMNLELLFWAARNSDGRRLYDIAVRHAETTMHNHFRPDYSAYHVVVYDTVTGKKIKGVTHQGYSDSSMWARGQTWAIYGFTMCYRETHKEEFLDFAEKVADVYLRRLPADRIPYWDFDDPGIERAPRDASAAAIAASALLELSGYVKEKEKAVYYRDQAVSMLAALSSGDYQARDVNPAFLLHATGHKRAGTEVDASIIYGDYYYIEALLRLKRLPGR
jgi:unsaturated chondroitin disaccharide hydrolase